MGEQIRYGDFVMIKQSEGSYLSITPIFEQPEKVSDFSFRPLQELYVMDINYFLFQILPSDEGLIYNLFGEDFSSPHLNYLFNKEKIFQSLNEKFKMQDSIGFDKEVRLFNPFFCTFLSYKFKDPIAEKICKSQRQVDGTRDWSSIFKIKVEFQRNQEKVLTHGSSISFQASIKGDYSTQLFLATSRTETSSLSFPIVKSLDKNETGQGKKDDKGKNKKSEQASKLMFMEKFMSFEEFRKCRFNTSRRVITPIDYIRFLTNVSGEEYYIASLKAQERWDKFPNNDKFKGDIGLVCKDELSKWSFLSIFQLMEHESLALKEKRSLNMYSFPYTISANEQSEKLYPIRPEFNYNLHLPLNYFNFKMKDSTFKFPYTTHISQSDLKDNDLWIKSAVNKPDKKGKMFLLNKIDEVPSNRDYWEPLKEDTTFYIGYLKRDDTLSNSYFLKKSNISIQERELSNKTFQNKIENNYLIDLDGYTNVLESRNLEREKYENLKKGKLETRKIEEEERNKLIEQLKLKKEEEIKKKIELGEIEKPEGGIIVELEENEFPPPLEPFEDDEFKENFFDDVEFGQKGCNEFKSKIQTPQTRKEFEVTGRFEFDMSKYFEKNPEYDIDLESKLNLQFECLAVLENEVLDIFRLISLQSTFKELINNYETKHFATIAEKLTVLNLMLKKRLEISATEDNPLQHIIFNLEIPQDLLTFLENNFYDWKRFSEKSNSMAQEDPVQEGQDKVNKDENLEKSKAAKIVEGEDKPIIAPENVLLEVQEKPKENNLELIDFDQNAQKKLNAIESGRKSEKKGASKDQKKEKNEMKENEMKAKNLEELKIKKKDTFIEFFELVSKNNSIIKNWLLEKIGILFELSKKTENFQEFTVKSVIENNKILEESIDILQVNNIFSKLNEIMSLRNNFEDDFNYNDGIESASKLVILNIFNKLYKDISLIHPGTALATYLNYFIKSSQLREILVQISTVILEDETKVDDKRLSNTNPNTKLMITDLNSNVNLDAQTLKSISEKLSNIDIRKTNILKQQIALTYHLCRVPNIFFLSENLLYKSKDDKDMMYKHYLGLVKNSEYPQEIRSEILELISTLHFHGALRIFPLTIKYTNKIQTEYDSKIKDMHEVYLNACKNLETEHMLLKAVVQKKLVMFDLSEAICAKFIKELLDNYTAYRKAGKQLSPLGIDNVSKTLARLCDLYKIELAKEIKLAFINKNYDIGIIKEKMENCILVKRAPDLKSFLTKSLDLKSASPDEISRKITNISKFSITLAGVYKALKSVVEMDMGNAFEIFTNWESICKSKANLEESTEKKESLIFIEEMNKGFENIYEVVLKMLKVAETNKYISLKYSQDNFDYKALNQIFRSKLKDNYFKKEELLTENYIKVKPFGLIYDFEFIDYRTSQERKEAIKIIQHFLRESEIYKDLVDFYIFFMQYSSSNELMDCTSKLLINVMKLLLIFIEDNTVNAEILSDYLTKNEVFVEICKNFVRLYHFKRAISFVFLAKIYSTIKNYSEKTMMISTFLIYYIEDLETTAMNAFEEFFKESQDNWKKFCPKCHSLILFSFSCFEMLTDCEVEERLIISLRKQFGNNQDTLENLLIKAKKLDFLLIAVAYKFLDQFETHFYYYEKSNNFNKIAQPINYSDLRTELTESYLKEMSRIVKHYSAMGLISHWNKNFTNYKIYYSILVFKEGKIPYYYHKFYFHFFQLIMSNPSLWNESLDFTDFQYSFFSFIFLNTEMANTENEIKEGLAKLSDKLNKNENSERFQEFSERVRKLPDYYKIRTSFYLFPMEEAQANEFKIKFPKGAWDSKLTQKYIILLFNLYMIPGYEVILFKSNYSGQYGYNMHEILYFVGYIVVYIQNHQSDFDKRIEIFDLILNFFESKLDRFKLISESSGDSYILTGIKVFIEILKDLLNEKNDKDGKKIEKGTLIKSPLQFLNPKEEVEYESYLYIQIQKSMLNHCQSENMNITLVKYETIFDSINTHNHILEYSKKIFEITKLNFKKREKELCMILDLTYAALYFYIEKQISRKYKNKVSEEEKIGQVIDLFSKAMVDLDNKLIEDGSLFNSIYKILEKTNSTKVLMKTLRLANILLDFTNRDVQAIFFDKLSSDDYNRVLTNLIGFLKSHFDEVRNLELKVPKNYSINNMKRFRWSDYNKYIHSKNMIIFILHFFKLLCEGHFDEMQSFLFEQKQDGELHENPLNVVEIIVKDILEPYIDPSFCKPSNYDLGNMILLVLIEVIQGDVGEFTKDLIRQNELLNLMKIFYKSLHLTWDNTINYKGNQEDMQNGLNPFMLQGFTYKVENVRKIMQLIQSIIENSSKDVIKDILEGVDWIFILNKEINFIKNFLVSEKKQNEKKKWEIFIKHSVSEDDFMKYFIPLIDFTVIKSTIEALDPIFKTTLRKKIEDPKLMDTSKTAKVEILKQEKDGDTHDDSMKIHTILSDNYICSVEIVDERKNLKIVYFPKPVICRYLTQKDKDKIIWNLDRTTYQTKVAEFLGMKDILKAGLMNIYSRTRTIRSKVSFSVEVFSKNVHFLVAIILSGMLLWGSVAEINNISSDTWDRKLTDSFEQTFYALVFLEILLSVISFSYFIFSTDFYYEYLARWDRYAQKARKDYGLLSQAEILSWAFYPENLSRDDQIRLYRTMGPKNPFFLITKLKTDIFLKLRFLLIKVKHLIHSFALFRYTMYILFSGLILHHPVFAPILLLLKLFEYKTVQNVLQSFTKNWREFGVTICFGLAIIMIYSAIGFYSLQDTFFAYDDGEKKNLCQNLWLCFLSIINYGIRAGGGIGDELFKIYRINYYMYAARWVFDFTFFILIIVILMNLIFGIIIDTFSDINKKQEDDFYDQTNKCFICGLEKETINQKIEGGFDVHVKKDHYMWNYIFYLIYLDQKGVMELSSLESGVWFQFKNKKFDWIPYGRSIKLENVESEDTIQLRDTFTHLNKLNTVFGNLSKSSKLDDLTKKEKNIVRLNKKINIFTEMNVRKAGVCVNEFIRELDPSGIMNSKVIVYYINSNPICKFCKENCLSQIKFDDNKTENCKKAFSCGCSKEPQSKMKCVSNCFNVQYPSEKMNTFCKRCLTCNMDVCKYCANLCHSEHKLEDSNLEGGCECNDRLGCLVRAMNR